MRFMPRGAEYRYYYTCLERYFIENRIKTLSLAVEAQCVVLFRNKSCVRQRKLLCIIGSALSIKALHDEMTKKHVGNFFPTQGMQCFDEQLFLKCFDSVEIIFIKCWLR